MKTITRRFVLSLASGAAAAVLRPLRVVAAALPVERLSASLAGVSAERAVRYRADATVLLLGMPIYTREQAGGGVASIRECIADNRCTMSLRFSAGSYPDRARGLNRLGLFEEVVIQSNDHAQQAAYFGFLTSSPEESAEEGLESIENTGDSVVYKAIDGAIEGGWEQARRADFELPSNLDWSGVDRLESMVRDGLAGGRDLLFSENKRREGAPSTFLHAVMSAAWSGAAETQTTYCYNGERYELRAERKEDRKTARQLLASGVIDNADAVAKVEGRIRNLDNDEKTSFRLWIDARRNRPLPLRFDYKARSFLRVAFEAIA